MALRLGPAALCALLALYRAAWLSRELSSLDPSVVGFLLLADLPVFGVLTLLAIGEPFAGRRWKWMPVFLTTALLLVYIADAALVMALNSRLQLSDLYRFGSEWWLARSYLTATSLVVFAAAVGSLWVRIPLHGPSTRWLGAGAVAALVAPLLVSEQAIPSHLERYTGSVLRLAREAWGARTQPPTRYRAADFTAYQSEYDELFEAPFARSGRDVVLVMVESLSAVDSYRTSGVNNRLPRFDELSQQGTLFTNFFANFEASEGGIIALLSGLPPLHFPTASTNTFAEYALQRSITAAYARSGYRCEFLTSVPLQFISMDEYMKSPQLGFAFAGGQKEIARFESAPRFGFQSPADHLLYEELLARLDARDPAKRQPMLMTLVTASSHPPYVDPLGKNDSEEGAWRYVQEELWWLHDELQRRGFFENGLLVITGDHRKMRPIGPPEHDRYGESAKARVPLVMIGAGAAKGALDDRLFQQADLLRMLDKALQPGVPLSAFALWVERYVFVFGTASNAANLQVFDLTNDGREPFRLHMRGAELEWQTRPSSALPVERAVHRQRAAQQARRAASLNPIELRYGPRLTRSNDPGVLIGLSSDDDLSRDPADARGALQTLAASTFDLEPVLKLAGGRDGPFTLTARAFIQLHQEGEYWFSVYADHASCLAVDEQTVLACQSGLNEGVAWLSAGLHRIDLRYIRRRENQELRVQWMPPGARRFSPFPQNALILPQGSPPVTAAH
jgi:hypothetical protein